MGWKPDIITMATLAALAAILILGAVIFKPHLENPRIVFVEEPLVKNAEFGLVPGETYTYGLDMNGSSGNITYFILPGPGCTRIRMSGSNASGTCVDRNGLDETGYNATLGDPMMLLFRPWMLALREGWHWNSSMYVIPGGAKIAETRYRVIRMENYSGRESFVVAVESGDAPPEYQWIDAGKRVLLRILSENYEAVLLNATGKD